MDKTGTVKSAGFNRVEPALPEEDEQEIYGIIPEKRDKPISPRNHQTTCR